jgi:hypothetical protein
VHTGLWWGNRKEGDNLEDLGTDGKILKGIFKNYDDGREREVD